MKPCTLDTLAIIAGLHVCNVAPCLIRRDMFVVLTACWLPDRKSSICAEVKTSCVSNVLSLLENCVEYTFAHQPRMTEGYSESHCWICL
jgi:hypothetical protein